jgi:hypothetical protein
MKKTKKSKGLADKTMNNFVAKFAHQFNKAQVYQDKTKYKRTAKHKGKEPFPMFAIILEKASTLFVKASFLA